MAATQACHAGSIVAVYKTGAYPGPASDLAFASGLVFEVCTDGRFYRAPIGSAASLAEQGTLSQHTFTQFKAELEKKWLAPVRSECRARGILVDDATLNFEVTHDTDLETFSCTLYQPGSALRRFEAMIAALPESVSKPAGLLKNSACR